MTATNPGKAEVFQEPVTNIRKYVDITLGAMALQEPSAVAVTGGTVSGATVSGSSQATITEAGAISVDKNFVGITGPADGTYAVTLAAPSRVGQVLVIQMLSTTGTNAVTLALTNVIGGSQAATASFNAANETLVLVSASGKWVVLAEAGVTLS